MKNYTILVKETRIVEYYVSAETKQEAKEFFDDGDYNAFKVIKVDNEKIMDVME